MPQIYFGITTDGSASVLFGSPQYSFGFEQTQRNVVLNQQTGGTITAEPMSGFDNDVVTLSNTANAGYTFDTYNITGATLTGNQFMFNGYDVEVTPTFNRQVYTLTLQNDGHGTIAATKTTGYAGDTVTLSNTYNTYYRFNNYTQTGGSINGSTFTFGSQNATAKANFKVNAFTASGTFEKGSDVYCRSKTNTNATANVGAKYAITSYHTSNVPTAWYATSKRWKVTSTVSAYKISLNTKMTFGRKKDGAYTGSWGGAVTAISLIGSTSTASQSWAAATGTSTAWSTDSYNKSFSTTTTGVNYGVSAHLSARGYYNGAFGSTFSGQSRYVAANTNGTWTATGYAP